MLQAYLAELLAQTYVHTIVSVPEARLDVGSARRQKVGSESICGGRAVSVSRLVQKEGDAMYRPYLTHCCKTTKTRSRDESAGCSACANSRSRAMALLERL